MQPSSGKIEWLIASAPEAEVRELVVVEVGVPLEDLGILRRFRVGGAGAHPGGENDGKGSRHSGPCGRRGQDDLHWERSSRHHASFARAEPLGRPHDDGGVSQCREYSTTHDAVCLRARCMPKLFSTTPAARAMTATSRFVAGEAAGSAR